MDPADQPAAYGRATIEPAADVVAGRFGTWRLTVVAGPKPIAEGGAFRVYTDTDTDWGTPQLLEPQAADYLTVEAPPGVCPVVTVTGVKSLRVDVRGRGLQPDEAVTLVFGDTSAGGPGSRAQTFFEDRRFFWVDVDPDGSGTWHTLPDPPHLRVVGDEAVRLVATAVPSSLPLGGPFSLIIKAEDRWGNPAASYRGTVELRGEGFQCENRTVEFTPEDRGVKRVENCTAQQVGVLRIEVVETLARSDETAADRSPTLSNPVIVTQNPGPHQLYWADPHGGQLVHNEKFARFFEYARDVSGVQFVGFQRNADVLSREDWERQQQAERELTQDGRFIPIPGFEWSGRTYEGGHHNVYFRRHGRPARRNLPAEEMFHAQRAEPELPHVRDLYAAYRNTDTIITPHVGGEHSDLAFHEPELEPAVEVTSTHGSFEWMLFDALRRGYRMGFLGGSDCYTGRPGDDRPGHQLRRYAKSGLTGIYAKGVTLADFFEAMRARRVYATSGARIVVSFDCDGRLLGDEYTTSQPPTISAAVAGTAPLEKVELFRGAEIVYSQPLGGQRSSNRVRILWNGASRMTSYSGVLWDGTARVSGATIAAVETIRFDSPRSHLLAPPHSGDSENPRDVAAVRWHAVGCGYPQGVVLDLAGFDDPAQVEIAVSLGTQLITGPGFGGHGERWPRRISIAPAEHAAFCVRLADVSNDDVQVPLGLLDRRVTVSAEPTGRPLSTDFCVMDDEIPPGVNPYWLRVTQLDGEMAWSSPVFVDYAGE